MAPRGGDPVPQRGSDAFERGAHRFGERPVAQPFAPGLDGQSGAFVDPAERFEGGGETGHQFREGRVTVERCANHRLDVPHRLDRDRLDDLVFGAEVPVDRAGRQARLVDDVLHRGAVEAGGGEAAGGGVEDLVSPCGEVLGGDSWHGSDHKANVRS
nr:hypothetical protein [Glycomyces xiaoerkulensis]